VSSGEVCVLATISNADAEGVTDTGIDIGSSVSELRASNIHLYGQQTTGPGGTRPSFTTVGWRQNTPVVNGNAVGGHQAVNLNMITVNRGFHITDGQLSKFSNCFADSCSDYGILIDGASDKIEFSNAFVGTTRGIKVAGTSQNISFKGLETVLNGTIPPWGSTDFYNGVTTFYDLEVRDTAKVYVKGWTGSKRIIVDSTARLIVDDGINYNGRSIGTIGAASTTYLAEWGSGSEGDALWRAPYDGYLIRLMPTTNTAPGSGQSFTYTARLDFADTALVASIADGAFGGVDTWAGALVPVTRGQSIAIKLATSATAAAARHRVEVQFVPR
jgi:hypothetical protein